MVRKITSLLVAAIVGVAGFVASIRFFGGIGYHFLAMLLGNGGPNVMSNPVFMISLHSIIAAIAFFMTLQVAMNRYFIPAVKIAPIVYAIFALVLIMMKSRGVQGLNLNPLDLINHFACSPATVFFNMLVFLPFGITFHSKGVSFKESTVIGFAVSLFCEAAQFIFKLGLFDIVDITLNVFSFIFGYCIADYVSSSGFRFAKKSKYFYSVVRDVRV